LSVHLVYSSFSGSHIVLFGPYLSRSSRNLCPVNTAIDNHSLQNDFSLFRTVSSRWIISGSC